MLPLTDLNGRVYAQPAGTPAIWNAGVGYTADGRMCTTTTLSAGDVYVNGWRLDNVGRVVVGSQGATLAYNAGLPFNQAGTPGSMARQMDIAPSLNDPYVAGIRVGPLGGVYMTTSAPP